VVNDAYIRQSSTIVYIDQFTHSTPRYICIYLTTFEPPLG
jgi:hypothetical protein